MTGRIVVLASGSGSNLQALLDAIDEDLLDGQVVAVIVNRRSALAQQRAEAAGIPNSFVPMAPYRERIDDPRAAREAYDDDLADMVAVHAPDVVVLAGWMHIFTMQFLSRFRDQVINLHPALPGQFPGAHAIDDAWEAHIDRRLDRTGVMVHLIPDEGVDDGPVLATREIPILVDDDRGRLEERIHAAEHELLVEAVGAFLRAA